MRAFDVAARRPRARQALALMCVAMAALGAGFFHLQITGARSGPSVAAGHRAYPVPVPAPRGLIVDRSGAIMADRATSYAVVLVPTPAAMSRQALADLAAGLGLDPTQLGEQVGDPRDGRSRVVLATNVSYGTARSIDEARHRFPGAYVETRTQRVYPAGHGAGHLLAAVEREYDAVLGGVDGLQYVAVDATGAVVGPVETPRALPPVAGRTVRLAVDLELQRLLRGLVPATARGAAVALEPGTGRVLAILSSPGREPDDAVVGGAALADRAVGVAYPPGSTWHLVTAAIGLKLGTIEPSTLMPLPCRGGMPYSQRYLPCSDRRGHGAMTVADALAAGCDVFFYQLGLKVGSERLVREAGRLGFGDATGIDLPGEPKTPLLPPGWPESEPDAGTDAALRLGAGQAPLRVTPLRMAYFLAALASETPVRAPSVLFDPPRRGPRPVLDVGLDAAATAALRAGLRKATRAGGSSPDSGLPGWDWGGIGHSSRGEDAADWFVGVGGPEGGEARIVVAVVLEDGGHGTGAATVATRAVGAWLRGSGAAGVFRSAD
jgi:penicillin-binding protein 2